MVRALHLASVVQGRVDVLGQAGFVGVGRVVLCHVACAPAARGVVCGFDGRGLEVVGGDLRAGFGVNVTRAAAAVGAGLGAQVGRVGVGHFFVGGL